ncbi:transcriptional regulator, LuxR family [Formosa agariphila KMM 3901]|uniref:Transcriptional regulator, LuxR family n=1 Tax=Formosa agariphila (strain DSM 15362 / KCTC 12365 / LMG 23005 / KMM 3901 / M-2Alg 35-1) TaxID=1347342 RepID=T2KMQ9_FORAG|nr:transcriptional regulator, LuxR family [Formosa agariphila KMM 3901]
MDPESSHSDLYRAYLQKYDVYKSVFNYTQALNNLDLALKEGVLTQDKDKIKIQIKVERLFVYFDLLDFDKVNEIAPTISKTDLAFLDEKTQGFYYSVLAVLEIRKKNYDIADTYLNEALVILEKSAPEHLPLIYRKKLGMYREQGNHDKVIESFEKGLYYAEQYETDIYIIAMYDDISVYYAEVGDYKNAHIAATKVNNLATEFNGHNRSSKLQLLEKNLLQKRKELEVENEKRNRNYLITLTGVLIIILLLLFYFFKSAKQKRIIAELETNNMRNELERVTQELNESGHTKLDLNAYNLTERQLQIIDLVKQGKSNKEIGEDLFISVNTVKYHLKIIYEALNINNRSEL